jgi:nucleotide-binding universal stress UspA family protein
MISPLGSIQKILAAIDFSSYSRNTLEYAFEVAKSTNAELWLINIINQRDIDAKKEMKNEQEKDGFVLSKFLAKEISLRELKIQALVKRCGFGKRAVANLLVDYGVPAEKILQAVNVEKIDLLVIGPKGRTNLAQFFFGSVAEKCFRHSPVPVMSLRSRVK